MLLKTLRRIVCHPSNKDHKSRALCRFVWWQACKRIIACPIVVKSCGKRFLAYPDCIFSSMLLYFKVPEYEELAALESYSESGRAVFFDVGANIGFYSLTMEEHFSEVHAFDPNPEAIRRLNENLVLNRLHVKVNGFGLYNAEKEMHLHMENAVDPTACLQDVSGKNTISVPVMPLDKYIEETDIKEKIVMKIDVEGAELEVLQGAVESLREKRFSLIQFESLSEQHLAAIINFVKDVGYDVCVLTDSNLSSVKTKVAEIHNYYLVPQQK